MTKVKRIWTDINLDHFIKTNLHTIHLMGAKPESAKLKLFGLRVGLDSLVWQAVFQIAFSFSLILRLLGGNFGSSWNFPLFAH